MNDNSGAIRGASNVALAKVEAFVVPPRAKSVREHRHNQT